MRHDFRHVARVDLRSDFEEDADIEPIEDLCRVARLHRFVHDHEALETRGPGIVLLLRGDGKLRLAFLDLREFRVDALLRFANQALADIEFAGALVELLPALLQTLKDRRSAADGTGGGVSGTTLPFGASGGFFGSFAGPSLLADS